jgi:hypothetical protein
MIEHRPIKGDFDKLKQPEKADERDKHPEQRELKERFPTPELFQKGHDAVDKAEEQIKEANRVLDQELKKAQQPRPAPPGVNIEAERQRAIQRANTQFRSKVDTALDNRDKALKLLDTEQRRHQGQDQEKISPARETVPDRQPARGEPESERPDRGGAGHEPGQAKTAGNEADHVVQRDEGAGNEAGEGAQSDHKPASTGAGLEEEGHTPAAQPEDTLDAGFQQQGGSDSWTPEQWEAALETERQAREDRDRGDDPGRVR